VTDVTSAHLEEAQIRDLAFQDSLTGLANRRRLLEQLDEALLEAATQRQAGALVFLDLDNFKPLNDTHGHATGDLLLREVGRRLQGVVRQRDVVARFGGDEFVLLIMGLSSDLREADIQARKLAEKVRAALAETYRLTAPNGPVVEHTCTASVGVALFGPDGPPASELLERADRAMYRAKQGGRNQVAMDSEGVASCGTAALPGLQK
jgi:diguanylate cyclase (GGDEF)-like protein